MNQHLVGSVVVDGTMIIRHRVDVIRAAVIKFPNEEETESDNIYIQRTINNEVTRGEGK